MRMAPIGSRLANVTPLPYKGVLVPPDHGCREYHLTPAGEAMYKAMIEFLAREMGATRTPEDMAAYGYRARVNGQIVRTLSLAACIASAPVAVVSAQAETGVVSGVVTDSAGTAIQGATIRVTDTGEQRRVTDTEGRFAFERVSAGTHAVRATMVGSPPVTDAIVVRVNDTVNVTFMLHRLTPRLETLPPRVPPGARADTAPGETETIDHVARVAGLPRLRAQWARAEVRELRFWIGGGMAIPMQLLRITETKGQVRGELIQWVQQVLPDSTADRRWRAFMDSLPHWLRREFRCFPLVADTVRYEGAQPGYQRELTAACRTRFVREPDWSGLLREFESHHVWTLPDASEVPQIRYGVPGDKIITVDGVGITVEAWDGRRYHTYTYGNPAQQAGAEYRDTEAMLMRIVRLGPERADGVKR
jgi:hypothetical protein